MTRVALVIQVEESKSTVPGQVDPEGSKRQLNGDDVLSTLFLLRERNYRAGSRAFCANESRIRFCFLAISSLELNGLPPLLPND